jgi:transposase
MADARAASAWSHRFRGAIGRRRPSSARCGRTVSSRLARSTARINGETFRAWVDVLDDRSATRTAEWFRSHPEVEIVSRDRCGLYAQGARDGANRARQIADRFQLLQNLREAIEAQLSRVHRPTGCALLPVGNDDIAAVTPKTRADVAEQRLLTRRAHRCSRQALFDQVHSLRKEGHSTTAIVLQTGVKQHTVGKWLKCDAPPERRPASPKTCSPYYFLDYLSRRWSEGCVRGRHLLSEIRLRGYTGSISNLQSLLAQWRRADESKRSPSPAANRQVEASPTIALPPAIDPATGWSITSIVAAALCIKPRGALTKKQAAKVDVLKSGWPDFTIMRQLAMRFRRLLQNGGLERFAA